MPASLVEIDSLLYRDALLELGRAARAFGAAMIRAAELAEQRAGDGDDPLAARVLDDCRAALLPALVRAPGMLQLFQLPGAR